MFDFNKQFFSKNQNRLVWVANKWYARWLLGLNRLPKDLRKKKIGKITPNSVHWREGDKIVGAFFNRPRFAEALAFNLSPFVYLMNNRQTKFQWRFSPVGAMTMLLLAFWGGGFAFAGTTTNYYAGAGDGETRRVASPTEAWATIRSGAGTYAGGTSATGSAARIAASTTTNEWEVIVRGILQIDTSGLGSSATISSAASNIYIIGLRDNLSAQSLNITSVTTASSTTLATGDFDLTNHGSTKFITDKALSTISTSAYLSSSLNSSGISNINKTGYTTESYRLDGDIDNVEPTWSSGNDANIDTYYSEQTGTANDPYLSVTYTITVSDDTNFFGNNF